MKQKRWLLGLFVVACAAQAAIPLAMIFRAEGTRSHGDVYRFRCSPVDPMDPFRGSYVALGFDVETQRFPTEQPLTQDEQAFATLAVDANGFTRIVRLTRTPGTDETAIRVRIVQPRGETASVDLPFDRFFLNETAAPEVERAYRQALRDRDIDTWAEVRVHGTSATLVGLSIDGVPAEDYARTVLPR